MDALQATVFLGQPLWMWLGFLVLVGLLLAFDLGVLHRNSKEIGVRESLVLSALYIALGLGFGGFVWLQLGERAGVEYLTGFVVEKSLAVDNVFVIAMIFAALAIPREYQHRVLFWGVLGVIVLRAIMIGFGATLVAQHSWILYLFAAFLILTGAKMLILSKEKPFAQDPLFRFVKAHMRLTPELHGERFFVRRMDEKRGRIATFATPLFLALVMIEITDVIFAVDSVPAIFAITTDPYIVYTSNIFAILGLRALYFALAAVLLIFIGSKIFLADALGLAKFPAEWSLGVTAAILSAGVLYSLWRTRTPAQPQLSKG